MLDTEFKQSTDCIQFVTTALKTDVLPQSSLDPDNNEVIMSQYSKPFRSSTSNK